MAGSNISRLRIAAGIAPALLLAVLTADAADWTIDIGTDPASYAQVAVLQRDAADAISDEYGRKQVKPRLQFRCVPGGDGAVGVRVDWQRFISSFNTAVNFAVDERDPLTVTMGVDRSNRITSTKEAADDDALLAYLDGGGQLALTVTPYSEVPVKVSFDLAGLGRKLDELRQACGA